MFRPGDDPTPLDAASVEAVLARVRKSFVAWRAARLGAGEPAPEATGRGVDVVDLAETDGPLLHAALCGRML
jgi:hypothetical protein